MNRFWLYFGIVLVCTGIGTGLGIVLLMLYFWNDIKTTLLQIIPNNTEFHNDDSPNFYDDETLEKMR